MTKEVIVKRTKQIGGIVIGLGVGAIIGNAVKFTTPSDLGRFMKACVGIGSFALGGLAADATVKYANDRIDEASEMIDLNFEPDEVVDAEFTEVKQEA